MVRIVTEPIDIPMILESLGDPSAGGIDLFVGTTRNHSRGKKVLALEYEAYLPMALNQMQEIADGARKKWDIRNVSIVHRIGRVDIGEASVVIGVSATHRNEAFEACRYCIDTLKKVVPIWKKEFFVDGEAWVGPQGGDQ
ncbi:MAG: molybdenum cofactor biosynthesis protein MoaE [Ignavibacteria bacterium]|nr:molybdenum cofactor biosynthesis protein MoaE [Ignavibacteria bacterium]